MTGPTPAGGRAPGLAPLRLYLEEERALLDRHREQLRRVEAEGAPENGAEERGFVQRTAFTMGGGQGVGAPCNPAPSAAEPEEEVHVGWEILKSLGLRHRGVKIISCPSCARQGFDVIRTVATLEDRLAHIETPITLSIIGCVVNGPGEALMTDLGLTGGGAGRHMVYAAGRQDHTVDGGRMVDHLVELVESKAAQIQAEEAAAKQAQAAE